MKQKHHSKKIKSAPSQDTSWGNTLLVSGFFFSLVAAILFDKLSWHYLPFYLLASSVCLVAYFQDKRAAQHGRWRISENRLHLLSLLGGWPGALLAQTWLRHKRRKSSFMIIFWFSAILNIAALLILASAELRQYLLATLAH